MKLTDLKHRDDFGKLCQAKGYKVGAEIGVAYGENAEKILEQWDGHLYLIDPWIGQDNSIFPSGGIIGNYQECYVYAMGKLSRFKPRFTEVRLMSDEGVAKCPQLDFMYIDGNHASPQVDRDIYNSWQKIKEGGIMGGHDYYDSHEQSHYSDVESVVKRFAQEKGLTIHLTPECSSWWIQK